MKRLLSLILACVMILGVLPFSAAAAEVVYESEPNDTKETAQRIYHDYNVGGSLDGMFGSDILDDYTFVLTKTEMVRITAMSSNSNYGFRLDGPNGYITGSDSQGTYNGMYVEEIEMTLNAGTYYISVVGTSYTDFGYALGLYAPSATADAGGSGSNEDDGFTLGREYTHTWNNDNYNENLYLDFSLSEDGYIDFTCSAFSNNEYEDLTLTLYNADGDDIWESGTRYSRVGNTFSMRVGLVAGDYTLEVEPPVVLRGEVYNATYSIDFTAAENYEKTPCNTKATANAVELNQWYTGVNGEYPQISEYWKIQVEEDCRVLIYMPEYDEMEEDGYVHVLDSKEERVEEGPYLTDDGTTYLAASLTAGTNYIRHKGSMTAQVEYSFMVELHECEYEWTIEREPTCTWEGRGDKYCPVCKDKDTYVEIPKTDHNYVNGECSCGAEDPNYVDFSDVDDNAWYAKSVYWAVSQGITTGTSSTTFEPDSTCTRNQVVTFLWRAAGKPEPTSTRNPFVDVKQSDYFYKAVLWAVENGITEGVDATHFAPEESCTRAQVAMFLWRTMDKPSVENVANPFRDVWSAHWFYEPVIWAVDSGVTNGTAPGVFSPDEACTRAQIVTFLNRALAQA